MRELNRTEARRFVQRKLSLTDERKRDYFIRCMDGVRPETFRNFSCGPIVHVRSPSLYLAVLTVFEFAKLLLPPEIVNSFPMPVNR